MFDAASSTHYFLNCIMETLVLRTKNKSEAKFLKALLHKMDIAVSTLSTDEQEDYVFGDLIKKAVKQGEANAESVEKIIGKWK
jgi:hypothetical protein